MEKSLSERIAARAVDRKSPPLQTHNGDNLNRAVFLALRPDIKQALGDGWSVKSIWETLHEEGKVSFGYDAFLRYTKRLILPLAGRTPPQIPTGEPDVAMPVEQKTGEPVTQEALPQIGGFTFNPSPKKEDLY